MSLALCAQTTCASTAGSIWRMRGFRRSYTLLAILGLSARRARSGRMAIACYFLLFFGITLLFYAGSYDYGADVRYSLATYPPLAILGGLGFARLVRWIRACQPGLPALRCWPPRSCFSSSWYLPVVRATTDGAWAARADVQFASRSCPTFGSNSYVLTHNPGMFQLWGVSAGQMSLASTNPAYLDDLAARFPAASTCTGISGATCRIRSSGSSARRSSTQAGGARARAPRTGPALHPVPARKPRLRDR